MSFELCNASSTFERIVMSIFSYLINNYVEVFMDKFTIHGSSFDERLHNLEKVLVR